MIPRTSWWCEHYQYMCDEFPEVIPTAIPSAGCSNSKSIIASWNQIAPMVVVGLLICILVFLILNLRKKVHHRSERDHCPGYGIPITLVEKRCCQFCRSTAICQECALRSCLCQ